MSNPARIYQPYGAALELFHSRSPEVLICGPSGTGKSRACLEKLNLVASWHPGARILICRKTRKSCTDSVLVTFEQHVLPADSKIIDGPTRFHRHSYVYPNGSEIVIGGLDNPESIMSTEFDVAYLAEGTECSEHEFELVLTRLRNGVVPYQQAIVDCNPSAPTHWIKRRADRGQMQMLESRHADNPACSADYLDRLRALTGVRLQRLFFGRWVVAEGAVYDGFNAQVHVVDRFKIPETWRRLRSIDFGYKNPFVCLWFAIDPDGRMFLYREIYMTGRLVEDHARQIVQYNEAIEKTVADHDAEDRATLERHRVSTVPAFKDISRGIQAVMDRLRPGDDGRPRLFLMRDSLIERDPDLVDAKLPTCCEEEFELYAWQVSRDGKPSKEAPADLHNHSMDAMRYAVVSIDDIRFGPCEVWHPTLPAERHARRLRIA